MAATDDTDEIFAENLRRARQRQELTQVEVIRRMTEAGFPFHHSTLNKIESGERPVRIAEAVALAKILDVDLAELLRPAPEDQKLRERLMDMTTYLRDLEHHLFYKERALQDRISRLEDLKMQHQSHVAAYERAMEQAETIQSKLESAAEAAKAAESDVMMIRDECQEAAARIHEVQWRIEELTRSNGEG